MRKVNESLEDYADRLGEMDDRKFLREIQDVHKQMRRKPAYLDAECVVMEFLMKEEIRGKT